MSDVSIYAKNKNKEDLHAKQIFYEGIHVNIDFERIFI